MKMFAQLFVAALLAVFGPSMATANPAGTLPGTKYVACIGASDLGSSWLRVVNDTTGQVHPDENINLLDGYQSVCDVLAKILPRWYAVSNQAVAGGVSFDLDASFGDLGGLLPPGYHAEAPGYVTQLEQALRNNSWNGQKRVKFAVLSLANDGVDSMVENAKAAIDIARSSGIPVIVQAFPPWGEAFNFVYEYENAVVLHGQFWGDVIRKLGLNTITEQQYNALRDFHDSELADYPGVAKYMDFSPGIDWHTATIDGVHPQYDTALRAASKLMNVMDIK